MPEASIKNFKTILFLIFVPLLLSGCSAVGKKNSAALQVTSNPQASVFLGEKHLGKTPYYSDQLEGGTYTIKVSAAQASYTDKITLKNGALTVVNRDLNNNLLAQSGEILWLTDGSKDFFIATSPSGSDITVDGQFKGKSPYLIPDLDYGDHKVKITKAGYKDREFSVKTAQDYRLMANVTLSSDLPKKPQTTQDESNAQKVEILNTPQGFLRVRKEPLLSSQEVGQVETGSNWELIQETDQWIKISFEGKLGWVSKQYTKKI